MRQKVSQEHTLPPIVEMTTEKERKRPLSRSPSKTPESMATKESGQITLKVPTRRPSIASPKRIPHSLDRKESVSDEKRDFDRRESGAGLYLPGRRESIGARRISFGTLGSRISAMIRAKNAFGSLRGRRKSKEDSSLELELNPVSFEIKELPKEPRFASTLSAEAQYAMMKGYEDAVYNSLCTQFPESTHLLRRNKTPVTGIAVKISDCKDKSTDEPDTSAQNEDARNENNFVVSAVNSRRKLSSDSLMSSSTPENERSSPTLMTSQTTHRSMTPSSTLVPVVMSENKLGNSENSRTLHLPRIPPREKQLVLTYRYHNAMDFLDMLREQQGLHRLSPREPTFVQTEPVKDFNTWSYVWNREFESKKSPENGNRHEMRNH